MDFEKLTQDASVAGQVKVNFEDSSMKALASERREAWGSLLSSLAASEKIENLILDPLIECFRSEVKIHDYLKAHSNDEVKHYYWLTKYVKANTQYVRRGKSLSDKVFYDRLIPRVSVHAKTKPVYFFALMCFYELFTLAFYKELMRVADQDNLLNAKKLFQNIRSDEIRHCRAAKELIRHSLKSFKMHRGHALQIWVLLRVFQLDMATFLWCVHNQRVRKSTQTLGISPARMWQMSSHALKYTMEFLRHEAFA